MAEVHWGVVLAGGGAPLPQELPPDIRAILSTCREICAADSGYLHARSFQLQVSLLLGDMDSLASQGLDYRRLGVPYQLYPQQKSLTDTQLAIQHLRNQGCSKILQIGGGSGRADQLFHHYHLQFSGEGADIWASDLGLVYRVSDQLQLDGLQGQMLGLFALGPATFSGQGLPAYLDNVHWEDHRNSSVCTTIEQPSAKITVHQGQILATVSTDRSPSGISEPG